MAFAPLTTTVPDRAVLRPLDAHAPPPPLTSVRLLDQLRECIRRVGEVVVMASLGGVIVLEGGLSEPFDPIEIDT